MSEASVQQLTCARIPTDEGLFQLCVYANNQDNKEHLAILHGDVYEQERVLARLHSECFTGDVLGSRRCDCGDQLHAAMHMIADEGLGVILYLRQEGRGIGLNEKLRAYNLQDDGYDTVDANLALGHQADERDYTLAALMLKDLGIRSIRLLTNNPAKIESLRAAGVNVVARVPLLAPVYEENLLYLNTKRMRMRHLLSIGLGPETPSASHG
jgi:GTP cyclohydrolase II